MVGVVEFNYFPLVVGVVVLPLLLLELGMGSFVTSPIVVGVEEFNYFPYCCGNCGVLLLNLLWLEFYYIGSPLVSGDCQLPFANCGWNWVVTVNSLLPNVVGVGEFHYIVHWSVVTGQPPKVPTVPTSMGRLDSLHGTDHFLVEFGVE